MRIENNIDAILFNDQIINKIDSYERLLKVKQISQRLSFWKKSTQGSMKDEASSRYAPYAKLMSRYELSCKKKEVRFLTTQVPATNDS